MRQLILLLTMMAVTLVVAGGIALAVNKVGTQGRDFLKGTDGADHLVGKGDSDRIFGLAGKDSLIGGKGKDVVSGGTESRPSGGDKMLIGGPDNDVVSAAKARTKYWAMRVTTLWRTGRIARQTRLPPGTATT